MSRIIVPTRVYTDQRLTDHDLVVYAGAQYYRPLRDLETGEIPVFGQGLAYTMYGTFDLASATRRMITSSLDHLIELGVILGFRLNHGRYLITSFTNENVGQGDRFAVIDFEELLIILRSSYKNKYALFRFLCLVIGSIDYKTKVGSARSEYFAQELGVATVTISHYMKALVDMGIIYTKTRTVGTEDGIRRRRYYGRAKDAALVDKEARYCGRKASADQNAVNLFEAA